jgi:hypothetical protein
LHVVKLLEDKVGTYLRPSSMLSPWHSRTKLS